MPNWVKTIVKTKPEVLKDVMIKYSAGGKFSFDKVIPMPKDLDIESGSSGELGLMFLFLESKDDIFKLKINEVFHSLNPFHSDICRDKRFEDIETNFAKYKGDSEFANDIELGKKYISNYNKYGHATWYDWCTDKWGTKWDLNSFQSNQDTMIFETAWGFAGNVILELSNKYPEAIFKCEFADEGIMENSGKVIIQGGKVIEQRYGLLENEIDTIWNTYIEEDLGQEKTLSENEIESEEEIDK